MKVEGNEVGMGGGIRSGHNRWIVEFDQGSSKVHINGKKAIRQGDACWMNGRNTRGKVICTDGMGPACNIKNGRPVPDTIHLYARGCVKRFQVKVSSPMNLAPILEN